MAGAATEDLRELARLLLIASEQGETCTTAALQDELGAGHDDLMGMLNTLREHGQAVEAAPGEWRGPMADEVDRVAAAEAPRVGVHIDDGDAEQSPAATGSAFAVRGPMVNGEATVRITRAIADALEDGALGALVKAGLAGVEDGELFVMEVLP